MLLFLLSFVVSESMLAGAKRFRSRYDCREMKSLDSALYKILTLDTQSMTSKTGSEKACTLRTLPSILTVINESES